MMRLLDETGARGAVARHLAHALQKLSRAARLGTLEVTVVLTKDAAIAELNQAWRGKSRPTDVLSFAAWEGEPVPGTEHVLGDIVISVETAARQAHELGHSLEEELAVLCAHGLLHLLGLDHERGPAEARFQAECEMTLLSAAGFDPTRALSGREL